MPSLYELLSLNAAVITPNQRLAQTLVEQWGAQQNKAVANYPTCYAFSVWLRHAFNQVIDYTPKISHPILIDNLTAIRIWHKLIAQQGNPNAGITLSDRLYQSWCQCQAYRCQ